MLYSYVATLDETVGIKNAEDSLSRFIESMEKGEETEIVVGTDEEVRLLVKEQEAETLQSGEYRYSIVSENQATGIQVVSKYEEQYILNYHDISGILERRNQNYELYRKLIICTFVVVAAVLYVFSWYITRPLTRVTKAARQISGGDYSVRMDCAYRNMKSYEVAELGRALNHLAEHTERHIRELEENARKKEDFMGSFTHEIKTPLTSIIGYADLLRTFDLEPEKRREYSHYIYTEGKRIGQLALHLLDLIVLGLSVCGRENIIGG